MSRLIYMVLTIVIVVSVFTMMMPLIVLALGVGLVYTIITRYKLQKEISKAQEAQAEIFENTEAINRNLEVIEAEYEEYRQ